MIYCEIVRTAIIVIYFLLKHSLLTKNFRLYSKLKPETFYKLKNVFNYKLLIFASF